MYQHLGLEHYEISNTLHILLQILDQVHWWYGASILQCRSHGFGKRKIYQAWQRCIHCRRQSQNGEKGE